MGARIRVVIRKRQDLIVFIFVRTRLSAVSFLVYTFMPWAALGNLGVAANWEAILKSDKSSSAADPKKTGNSNAAIKGPSSTGGTTQAARPPTQKGSSGSAVRKYEPLARRETKDSAPLLAPSAAGTNESGTRSKHALLIANGNYAHFAKLSNPITDAHLLVESLQFLGFNVTLVENASREGILDALQSFQNQLESSSGIAFFHYGGHGVQVDGRNYLIPVDADIPDERRVSTRAVDVEEVMTTLDGSGASAGVVVLDACRDNPLPNSVSRSVTRGLTVVQRRPKNSLIVYSAEPGSKALDGLFTPTLAGALRQTEKSLSQIMKEVRRKVFQISNGTQIPGEYDQLFEDLFLSHARVESASLRPSGVPANPEGSKER